MVNIAHARYETFDQHRRTTEALEADAADLQEIEQLEDRIKERLYQNEDQRELNTLSKHLRLIKNILNVTLTKDEFGYYEKNKK